jgi:hypothetical protein
MDRVALAAMTVPELNEYMAAVDEAAQHARESEVYDQDVLRRGEDALAEHRARFGRCREGAAS